MSKGRKKPAKVPRARERHGCGHEVNDFDWPSPLCPPCERVALQPDHIPAVLTITITSTGKVRRYSIPRQPRRAGRRRR